MTDTDLNLQTMIGDSARRIFADHITRTVLERAESGEFETGLWNLIRESGFELTLVPENAGGAGGTWQDATDLLFAAGAYNLPLPLADTMIANHLLAAAGIDLPESNKPIAIKENGFGAKLQVSSAQGTTTISGTADSVPWARNGDWMLISDVGSDGQTRIVLVDLRQAQGITIKRDHNMAGEPRDHLSFDRVSCKVAELAAPSALVRPVLQLGALSRSAMMSGGLKQVLDLGVRYANERIQFGKPIGKNQAIQQPLAMLSGEVGAAQMASKIALQAVSTPGANSQGFDIAVAKVRNGQAATQAGGIVHQVHGAIGFTYEHMLHFSTRRLWSWRSDFGSEAYWSRLLGQAAIKRGGEGFWPAIAGRDLQLGL